MRRSNRYATILVAMILAIVAGGNIGVAQTSTATVTVAERQNGSTIELSKGQTLVIRLSAQLGTGFSWAIQKTDGVAMELVKSDTEGGTGMPGAAETQVFVLKPAKTGTAKIELAYRQPWMRDTPPAKTFNLQVIVR